MKLRATVILVMGLLAAQFVIGCATTNEDLPAGREVKTVDFPKRHVKFSDISCRQEYEQVNLSGTLTNVSPYELSYVVVEVKMLFAGEAPFAVFAILTDPPALLPGDTAEFSLETEVEVPVAVVELHALFEQP